MLLICLFDWGKLICKFGMIILINILDLYAWKSKFIFTSFRLLLNILCEHCRWEGVGCENISMNLIHLERLKTYLTLK
jgi:hypothetical protein